MTILNKTCAGLYVPYRDIIESTFLLGKNHLLKEKCNYGELIKNKARQYDSVSRGVEATTHR